MKATPKFLYRWHGALVSRLFEHEPTRWRDRAPLAAVRFVLNKLEMHDSRRDFARMRDELLRLDLFNERLVALKAVAEATERRSASPDQSVAEDTRTSDNSSKDS